MMKHLHSYIFFFVAGIMLFTESGAQVTFNYDKITICEGEDYDLLNFRTNEVVVSVGWEIIGWQGINNTDMTVQPTVSPTVYTLEYRETANPSVVHTQNLTVLLRPKPTVSITSSGKQTVCINDNVHIQIISAANYDAIYWQREETGDKYYTNDINFTATDAKTTYVITATNNDCAFLATDRAEFVAVNPNTSPIQEVHLKTDKTTGNKHAYPYCNTVYLKDFVDIVSIGLLDEVNGTTSSLYTVPNVENNLYKATSYRIIWDASDIYTQGAPLTGQNYSNTFTVEIDLLFKNCNITKTFTEKRELQLTYDCFVTDYNCDVSSGVGSFHFNYPNVSEISTVEFINKTTPGRYIPVKNTDTNYRVLYDVLAPDSLTYDFKVAYKALDGTAQEYSSTMTVVTCPKNMSIDMLINYFGGDDNSAIDFTWTDLITWCNSQLCSNRGVGNPANPFEITVCQGEDAYLALLTEIGNPLEIRWNHPEEPLVWDPVTNSELDGSAYQYDSAGDVFKISMPYSPLKNYAYFKVSPQDTAIYTGTLFGVPFAFKVNVVDNHLAITDTAICSGQSIDLATLEKTQTANGPVSWSVTDTHVNPLIDTKYLVYGIPWHKCKNQTTNYITDTVLVRVDVPFWMTVVQDIVVETLGNPVSLADYLNTNVSKDKITWYDKNHHPVDEAVTVAVPGITDYYAVAKNACGADTIQIKVFGLSLHSFDEQICEGEEYIFGGQTLTESGIYRDTIRSWIGCDSMITTLNLTVEAPSPVVQMYETIYTRQYYLFNDREYREAGEYTATLTNQAGCDSVVILHLEVMECPEIEIPIFFTPNVDGLNKKWEIKNINCHEHEVEIFDRFGKSFYCWRNNFTGWDGTYRGRPMPSTDYWYRIILNEKNEYAGHFTLLR